MQAGPNILVIFLISFVFLILLLAAAVSLPYLLRKKEERPEQSGMNAVMGAFDTLGSEIKSLKEQLIIKERLAAIGEVSAGISHELRNPMSVIAGNAKLLLKGLDENDSRRETVKTILKEIEEMNMVMEELLKFSRSEPLHKSDVDISKIVGDVIGGMGDAGKSVEFAAGKTTAVKGDETLLKQAIKNLIQNGLDAGDTVSVNIDRGRSADKNGIVIVVSDNGRGIPKDNLNKIFMPFYTTKEGGSGIGLALVQKIAVGHGGSVSVESEEGKGSSFRLFLPVE
jgi:signal transduction histidine kinase